MRSTVVALLCCFFFNYHAVWSQVGSPLAVSFNVSNLGITDGHHGFLYWGEADSSVMEKNIWHSINWDTKAFNPFDDDDITYPFEISFEDMSYAKPVDRKMVITSHYGWRNGVLHRGTDLDLVTGDDVYALLDGKVRYVRYHAGHGKTVVIRHSNGLETVYAHLSKQLVEENDLVVKGQSIGKGGTTGNARGSHLHLEVRYKGSTINPEYFFDFEAETVRAKSSWITKDYADPRNYSSGRRSALPIIVELPTKSKPIEEVASKPMPSVTSETKERSLTAETPPARKTKIPDTAPGKYTIQSGDTLYSLARKHDTTVDDICRVNGINNSFKIRAGQKIILDF